MAGLLAVRLSDPSCHNAAPKAAARHLRCAVAAAGWASHPTFCLILLSILQGPANLEAICMLVEMGADVEATLAARSLETPLHIAARSGRGDILARLIKCPNVRGSLVLLGNCRLPPLLAIASCRCCSLLLAWSQHVPSLPPLPPADLSDVPHQGWLHRAALWSSVWADARAGAPGGGRLPSGCQGQCGQHTTAPGCW